MDHFFSVGWISFSALRLLGLRIDWRSGVDTPPRGSRDEEHGTRKDNIEAGSVEGGEGTQ